jgi:DNA-binding MarR family transcriptional regulator
MNEYLKPQHCVSNHLHQTARAVNRVYSEELRPLGLTRSQFSILGYLNKLGNAQLTELADLLFMDRTTLSRNLKPLQKQGLVSVSPNELDRRAKELNLTDEGKALFKEATKHWRRAQKRILDTFGSENWAKLETSLERLRKS